MIRIIDLTETYKLLDGINEPTERVKSAREKVLDHLLIMVEGLQMMGPVKRGMSEIFEEIGIPKQTAE